MDGGNTSPGVVVALTVVVVVGGWVGGWVMTGGGVGGWVGSGVGLLGGEAAAKGVVTSGMPGAVVTGPGMHVSKTTVLNRTAYTRLQSMS